MYICICIIFCGYIRGAAHQKTSKEDMPRRSKNRVGSSVGHGQHSRPSVFELKVLIWKLRAVDGLATLLTSRKIDTQPGSFR